jgi:hypothetical protein
MGSQDYTFGEKNYYVASEEEMLDAENDAVVNLSKFATDRDDYSTLANMLGLDEALCRLRQSRTPKTA